MKRLKEVCLLVVFCFVAQAQAGGLLSAAPFVCAAEVEYRQDGALVDLVQVMLIKKPSLGISSRSETVENRGATTILQGLVSSRSETIGLNRGRCPQLRTRAERVAVLEIGFDLSPGLPACTVIGEKVDLILGDSQGREQAVQLRVGNLDCDGKTHEQMYELVQDSVCKFLKRHQIDCLP